MPAMEKGQHITYRDRFTNRPRKGQFVRTLDNGKLVVVVAQKAARGGAWVGVKHVVCAESVIAS